MDRLALRNPFPGGLSYKIASTPSTQIEARALVQNSRLPGGLDFPSGSLIVAEEQSRGRGRFPERRWESEAGKNLLFTLFLDPSATTFEGEFPAALPLKIGAALCSAVAAYAGTDRLSPRLKWPNDLMLGDRKAAGILCEAGSNGVFAGVGLNCNQLDFPPELEVKATSLARELGREVERWALLEGFLEALVARLRDPDWRRKAEGLLWRRGEDLRFLPGSEGAEGRGGRGALFGRIEGIAEDGSLLFREEGASHARSFVSGELSLS
jgi:BirA family transcriptional regulator, biotin operon repressor / biotin---[acetyl-CoA-carboxylase] ligase